MKDRPPDRILRWMVAILLVVVGAQAQAQPSGPTLDEPFHMPTLTDTSTLDVVVVEPWHVDTINGTTRQKLINIHVDDWWPGVEIRVPVRLVVPLQGSVQGFVITGTRLGGTGKGDKAMTASDEVALDGGVGVVMTKIKKASEIIRSCPRQRSCAIASCRRISTGAIRSFTSGTLL